MHPICMDRSCTDSTISSPPYRGSSRTVPLMRRTRAPRCCSTPGSWCATNRRSLSRLSHGGHLCSGSPSLPGCTPPPYRRPPHPIPTSQSPFATCPSLNPSLLLLKQNIIINIIPKIIYIIIYFEIIISKHINFFLNSSEFVLFRTIFYLYLTYNPICILYILDHLVYYSLLL